MKAKFAEMGIAVLTETELHKLAEIIPCEVSFTGSGTPHFVRKNIDSKEFCFIANVENEQPVSGKLTAYGREKEIYLYPGDVYYISADYDNIPPIPPAGQVVSNLPEMADVAFESPNLLPLEWFDGGRVKTEEGNLCLTFACADGQEGVKLYIPKLDTLGAVSLDGQLLRSYEGRVYDDPYYIYCLPVLTPGQHQLLIEKAGAFREYDRILLEGEFDVDISSTTEPFKTVLNLYNIKVSVPEKAEITLQKRRNTLSTHLSWAQQGQIFYSGVTAYTWEAELPEEGTYRLTLPRVRDVATLQLDGEDLGAITRPPYAFVFTASQGSHKLTLRIANSLGNQMECYAEESGILSGGTIEKI